jgi:hypothetical protein
MIFPWCCTDWLHTFCQCLIRTYLLSAATRLGIWWCPFNSFHPCHEGLYIVSCMWSARNTSAEFGVASWCLYFVSNNSYQDRLEMVILLSIEVENFFLFEEWISRDIPVVILCHKFYVQWMRYCQRLISEVCSIIVLFFVYWMDMIDNDCVMIAFCSLNFYVRLATMHNTRVLSTKTSTVLRLRNASFFRFCPRSLLCLDPAIVDKIPGKQNDRKTLLGELNWIFTAITDTIAWNVLPRGEEFRILWLEV